MKMNEKKSVGKAVYGVMVVLTLALVVAGCAGMMAENKFREDAAAKYVFSVPAEKLLDEAAAYLSGGAFGAALSGGAAKSSLVIDREKLTVAESWTPDNMSRSRTTALITKVDDSHSTLVMNKETQLMDLQKKEWGNSRLSRMTPFEIAMIKRLDPQAAATIEEGAKKAAESTKKK